jgi:hypothetical protein
MVAFAGGKFLYRFPCLLAYIPTDTDEIKHLSIILIQIRFLIFVLSLPNIQLLKEDIILAIR